MKFSSTRGEDNHRTFVECVFTGLARDGGLYYPDTLPALSTSSFATSMDFVDTAYAVLSRFLGDELNTERELKPLCQRAFHFPLPLVSVEEKVWLLELFWGPTAAFKDVGARFLAEVFEQRTEQKRTVLVATSGDTGGAVASAFSGQKNVRVFVLFPDRGVSPLQRTQLTCWGDNITAIAVDGSFDDCQRMVKGAFATPQAEELGLTTANSINIGRLLPQICYYVWASGCVFGDTGHPPNFVIPTGNLGNAMAAFYAKAMGSPIGKIHLSVNANRGLVDYLRTHTQPEPPVIPTLANAMDVAIPSNLERLSQLHDHRWLQQNASATSVDDAQIKTAIVQAKERWGKMICPHTATAAHTHWQHSPDGPTILVGTAHPAKFSEIVEPLVGPPSMPGTLAQLLQRPTREEKMEPHTSALLKRLTPT